MSVLKSATVSVPATSANLGPGFDALGLALEFRDTVTARVLDVPGVTVTIEGEGASSLPLDEKHLIARTIIATCEKFGHPLVGLELECVNQIPQGRGLGSSAAAIVAGLVLARELSGVDKSDDDLLQLATDIEGHPDNVAACLLGGMTIAWMEDGGLANAVSMNVHPDITPVIGIPSNELSTEKARGLLPETVSHVDASFNAGRSALVVAAMIGDPRFLLEATEDRLHQNYRDAAYPESMAAVRALRESGVAACISGAGPTVLALCVPGQNQIAVEILLNRGFHADVAMVADEGAKV